MRDDENRKKSSIQALPNNEQKYGVENISAPYKLTSGASAIFWKFAKDSFFVYSCVLIIGALAISSKYLLHYVEYYGFENTIVLTGLRILFYFIFIVDVSLAMIVTLIMSIKLIREIWQ